MAATARQVRIAEVAYKDYEALGPMRSLAALQEQYVTRKTPKPVPTRHLDTLKVWSRTYGWQQRVHLHDMEAMRQEAERRALREEEARERERTKSLELADVMLTKAAEAMTILSAKQLARQPATLVRVAESARATQLRERGLPEHVTRQEITGQGGLPVSLVTGFDPSMLTLEEANVLVDLARKLKEREALPPVPPVRLLEG